MGHPYVVISPLNMVKQIHTSTSRSIDLGMDGLRVGLNWSVYKQMQHVGGKA